MLETSCLHYVFFILEIKVYWPIYFSACGVLDMNTEYSLEKIKKLEELNTNIDNFKEALEADPGFIKERARHARAWVHRRRDNYFANAKFVGFKDMFLQKYRWLKENTHEYNFNGGEGMRGIKRVTGASFENSEKLEEKLKAWGDENIEPGFFEDYSTYNWKFVSIK